MRRPRPSRGQPQDVDVHVGARVRLRRTVLGLTQEKLGAALGLTFQQVQKYERGTNRIGASRLYELSGVLDVPVAFFFEGLVMPPYAIGTIASPPEIQGHPGTLELQRDTLELVRAFATVDDRDLRQHILSFVKALAARVCAAE